MRFEIEYLIFLAIDESRLKKQKMNAPNRASFACRYCQYYDHEGRRGGFCQLLSVPVQGNWLACSQMLAKFSSPWDALETATLPEPSHTCNAAPVNSPSPAATPVSSIV